MTKINDIIKVDIETEDIKITRSLEREIKESINKIFEHNEDILIEKIAFSIFCMHYYNYDFMPGNDDYLINLKIKELKALWKLGKLKNKLQFFLNLAKKFYEVNFDK